VLSGALEINHAGPGYLFLSGSFDPYATSYPTPASNAWQGRLPRLAEPVTGVTPLSLAQALPVLDDTARVYIIGHPGDRRAGVSLAAHPLATSHSRAVLSALSTPFRNYANVL
jgi:hypothetical protein